MELIKDWHKEYRIESVFNRAIPHLFDGFKPIHRKAFFTGIKFLHGEMNTGAFAGTIKAKSNYHHGDLSIEGAVNNLAADFKNNIPMFIGEGNFGTKLIPSPAACRYTSIKINNEFTKYLFIEEVLEFTPQDDNNIYEPDFYLFKIPMILINGLYGIAVGLSTNILPYKVQDIQKNILRYLDNKPMKNMIPHYSWFEGNIIKENGIWYQIGNIEKLSSTTLRITELTDYYNIDTYNNMLEKMKQKGIILDYSDGSAEKYDFEVKVTKKFMEKYESNLIEIFKLKYALNENINVLNKNGNEVIHFNTSEELIKYYVDEIIIYIDKYIDYKIKFLTNEIDKNKQRIKFIDYIMSIDLRKNEIEDIKKYCIDNLGISEENFSIFIKISVAQLTKTSINKYENEIQKMIEELEYFKNTNSNEFYKKEIKNIC
jgi:DNA topoisomerase-2